MVPSPCPQSCVNDVDRHRDVEENITTATFPARLQNSTCSSAVRKKSSSAIDVTSYACLPFYSGARQLSGGFLIIGCTVASRTWRHRAFVRLSGKDIASQNYTERGDVVLDEVDRTASLSEFVVPVRLKVG